MNNANQEPTSYEYGVDLTKEFPEFESQFNLFHKILVFAEEVINEKRNLKTSINAVPVPDAVRLTCVTLATKALKTSAAIALLLQRGFIEDAGILLRSVLEVLINLKYIGQSQDLAQQYIEFEGVAKCNFLKSLKDQGVISEIDEVVKRCCMLVEGHFAHNQKRWTGKTIRERADRAGLIEDYHMIYALLCDIAHGGSMTTPDYVDTKISGTGIELSAKNISTTWFELIAGKICLLVLQIVAHVRSIFGEQENQRDISHLWRSLKDEFGLDNHQPEFEA